jgi:biopolymer transport protein ExbD
VANAPTQLPKVAAKKDETTTNGYDTKTLAEKLRDVKKSYSEQRAVTIAAEDGVNYEDLIGTIDLVTALDLPDVSVTPGAN